MSKDRDYVDKDFAEAFTSSTHDRICRNSKEVYVVLRQIWPILEFILHEEHYHRPSTMEVRNRLGRLLRIIDSHPSGNTGDCHMYMLTPEGWKPASFVEYSPPKWYVRPLVWLLDFLDTLKKKMSK